MNGLSEDDNDLNKRTAAKRGLGVQTKAYKEPKRNKDGSKMAPRKSASSFSNSTSQPIKSSGGDLQRPPKPRPQFKAVLMTEFGRKYTRASTVNKTADTAKRQKERIAKVSFFHQCIKMQIIPIKKSNIQTCFFKCLWFFRLKC